MPKFRIHAAAGALLLMLAGGVQADESGVTGRSSSAVPIVKKAAQLAVTLPAELVGLFFGRNAAAAPVGTDGPSASDKHGGFGTQHALAGGAAQQTVQLILSESRFRVWLRDDLNLQCELEQDRFVTRGDQFALKLALQFRFR